MSDKTCIWKRGDDWGDWVYWSTSCGRLVELGNQLTPKENGYIYCQNCKKEIEVLDA